MKFADVNIYRHAMYVVEIIKTLKSTLITIEMTCYILQYRPIPVMDLFLYILSPFYQ